MKVGRRGKDLALRIPAAIVRDLRLEPGDQIDLRRLQDGRIGIVVLDRVGDARVAPDTGP